MRTQYPLENRRPVKFTGVTEAAKLAAFNPGNLSPQARESWERMGHGFKAWHDFDQRHPILRHFIYFPFIGKLYCNARRRCVLRASGRFVE